MTRHLALALVLVGACAPPRTPPTPPATPEGIVRTSTSPSTTTSAVLDSGLACVHARAHCELGSCTAEVHNECTAPVACTLAMFASCENTTAPRPVRATSHETIPPDSATTLEANADCGAAAVLGARIDTLSCR